MIDEKKLIESFRASENTGRESFPVDVIVEAIECQPQVNNWIPCSERLPDTETEVYIQTERYTVTTAIYEDGKMPDDDSCWNWSDIPFDYDEETDTNYIPEGWFEYRHFNSDDVYNNVIDEKVIAWQPLPEPYREEEHES